MSDHSRDHAAVVLQYDPNHLNYTLLEEPFTGAEHPHDPAGPQDAAVGVHAVLATGPGSGVLLWHEVTLANWTATRAAFAAADPGEREHALVCGPAYADGKWGTHLGATMAVLTADDQVVLRSRTGKYAEEHLYDSLVAGTMLKHELTNSTDEYLRHLAGAAGIAAETIAEFHPTHLAMRTADFGLWIGGWIRVNTSAAEVAAAAPFETRALPLFEDPSVPLTDWGSYDLYAMRRHASGALAHDVISVP